MKIRLTRKLKQLGNALLICMCISAFLCISITGYLTVAEQQSFLSTRSQAWNMAIAAVEAGLEEGLEHMNVNPTQPGADGWALTPYGGVDWYTHTNHFVDGTGYIVSVNVTNFAQPVIVCRADVPSSRIVFFADINGTTPNPTIARAVALKTARGMLFQKALVAKNTIDLNGNNVKTDSFDSSDASRSWFGAYKPSYYVGDNGDIASNDTIVNSISGGNANIYGHAATGPGGTASVGSGGGIGSHSYQASNPGSIEPNTMEGGNWYTHDSNFTFPDTELPYNSGIAPTGPQTYVSYSNNISGTLVTSNTYPNPAPFTGVTTNFSWYTNTTLVPPPTCCLTANVLCGGQVKGNSAPAPGTYCPGSLQTNNSGMRYSWNIITGTNYTYASLRDYTYYTFTTNSVWTTNTYDYVLNNQDYYYEGTLSGKVLVLGSCRLVMPNGYSMGGSDGITIAQGGNLVMYVGGNSMTINGNAIANQANYAGNLVLFCAPSVTSIQLNGNAGFRGVIVAPTVDIAMNGGGPSAITDFTGALIVNSAKFNGHFNFHYDEALGKQSVRGRLLITSWDEVSPSTAPH